LRNPEKISLNAQRKLRNPEKISLNAQFAHSMRKRPALHYCISLYLNVAF